MPQLNAAQKALLASYCNGEFAAFTAEIEAAAKFRDVNVGDTLLTFLLIEISDQEDCTGLEDASRRVERAKDQLSDLIRVLDRAADLERRNATPQPGDVFKVEVHTGRAQGGPLYWVTRNGQPWLDGYLTHAEAVARKEAAEKGLPIPPVGL